MAVKMFQFKLQETLLDNYFEGGNEHIGSEKKITKNHYVKGSEWWKPMLQEIRVFFGIFPQASRHIVHIF